jgi:hypothetical protein
MTMTETASTQAQTAPRRNLSTFLTVATGSYPYARSEPSMIGLTSANASSAAAIDCFGPPGFLSGKVTGEGRAGPADPETPSFKGGAVVGEVGQVLFGLDG